MKDYVIFINGMTPKSEAYDWSDDYHQLIDGAISEFPNLKEALKDRLIFLQWGHPLNSSEHSPEAQLARAQRFIKTKIYPPRSRISKILDWLNTFAGYGRLAKVDNFLPGLGDVFWANTPQNLTQIRTHFINTFIQKGIRPDDIGQLHFISHSYGVTLAFDFIRDLFSSEAILNEETRSLNITGDTLRYWNELRKQVLQNKIKFGSLAGMASQLPMSITRHAPLLNYLSFEKQIPLSCMGINTITKHAKVRFYYDTHDVLGYPTAGIFEDSKAIEDCPVNTGLAPIAAHEDFWKTQTVQKSIGELLSLNIFKPKKLDD